MALVVYDHGYRIKTPVESIFPPRGVSPLTELKRLHRSADREDQLHADGEKFVLPEARPARPGGQAGSPATRAYSSTAKEAADQSNRRRLAVSHIMSQPVQTVSEDSTIHGAWQRMQSLGISHLVVAADDGRPLGLLAESDLLKAGSDSLETISGIYSRQLIAASPDTLVRNVASSFIENNINSMPVVNEADQVVGIVCRTDLLRLLVSGPHLSRWA